MLDKQNRGSLCAACGSPMRLTIEPSMWSQDVRSFACPQCDKGEQHVIKGSITGTGLAPTNYRKT